MVEIGSLGSGRQGQCRRFTLGHVRAAPSSRLMEKTLLVSGVRVEKANGPNNTWLALPLLGDTQDHLVVFATTSDLLDGRETGRTSTQRASRQ